MHAIPLLLGNILRRLFQRKAVMADLQRRLGPLKTVPHRASSLMVPMPLCFEVEWKTWGWLVHSPKILLLSPCRHTGARMKGTKKRSSEMQSYGSRGALSTLEIYLFSKWILIDFVLSPPLDLREPKWNKWKTEKTMKTMTIFDNFHIFTLLCTSW